MNNAKRRAMGPRRKTAQHLLVVSLKLTDGDIGDLEENEIIEELEQHLIERLEDSRAGRYDGNEIGGGYYRLFMSAADGDKLFDTVVPLVLSYPALRGSYLIQRCGVRGPTSRLVPLSVENRGSAGLAASSSAASVM